MSILCNFFLHSNFPKLAKYFEEKGMREILTESSKIGDRFTAISDLQNNEEHVYFNLLGIGKSVESFQSKFIVPRYLNIHVLSEEGTPASL